VRRLATLLVGVALVLGMGVGPPGSRSASVNALATLAPVSLQAPLVFALRPLADGEPVVDDVTDTEVRLPSPTSLRAGTSW
jgi:hypothetical protein